MAYTVPALPYPVDALEPYIDAKTMEIHHDKHHNAYVTNLNKAIEGTELGKLPIDELVLQRLHLVLQEIHADADRHGQERPGEPGGGPHGRPPGIDTNAEALVRSAVRRRAERARGLRASSA